MGIDHKDLKKIVSFLRQSGVISLKTNEFELTLHPSSLFPESNYKKKKAEKEPVAPPQPSYSHEDILFWSSNSPFAQDEAH